MSSGRRALHYVLKIGDRDASVKFYRDLLGMKPLRHEEFDGMCEATCNGPYDNKWSKTMIGYGPEDTDFVLELTYNYTVGSYKLGNDLKSLTLSLPKTLYDNIRAKADTEGQGFVTAPDGYVFYYQLAEEGSKATVSKASLNCSSLDEAVKFWSGQLGLEVKTKTSKVATLTFGEGQADVELSQLEGKLDRGTAFGRTAFSIPGDDLKGVESAVKAAGYTIQTPFVTLPTPGKADVQVVIFADPDGHEICFVGDEGFRDLSQVDPKANQLLDEALEKDGSKAWYAKKGKSKTSA